MRRSFAVHVPAKREVSRTAILKKMDNHDGGGKPRSRRRPGAMLVGYFLGKCHL